VADPDLAIAARLVTDVELLAAMRRQCEHATLETHVLSGGILHLRCGACRVNPVPANAINVMWCDPCLVECADSGESLEAFTTRKRAARDEH
jgi:hypothetical protein